MMIDDLEIIDLFKSDNLIWALSWRKETEDIPKGVNMKRTVV